MDQFELEEGKDYLNKDGEKVTINLKAKPTDLPFYTYYGSDGNIYNKHGFQMTELFTEYPDPSAVKDCLYPLDHKFGGAAAFEKWRLWGEDIFGPVVPSRIVARAKEEFDKELVPEARKDEWTDSLAEEAADVVIILSRIPGLWEAMERKMAKNYARKWNVKGDGTGYHIPQGEQ